MVPGPPYRLHSCPQTSCKPALSTPCIFLGEVGNQKELRWVATLGLDKKKKKECAQVVCDKHLLDELAAGDMVAIDSVYHCARLARLYIEKQKLLNVT